MADNLVLEFYFQLGTRSQIQVWTFTSGFICVALIQHCGLKRRGACDSSECFAFCHTCSVFFGVSDLRLRLFAWVLR